MFLKYKLVHSKLFHWPEPYSPLLYGAVVLVLVLVERLDLVTMEGEDDDEDDVELEETLCH